MVELKEGAEYAEPEIIDHCRRHLAGFKTPKEVIFREIPKTATGKVQKFYYVKNSKNDGSRRNASDNQTALCFLGIFLREHFFELVSAFRHVSHW